MTGTTENVMKEDLVVTRILDAPIELVWKAWTDPQHVMRWWEPKYYSLAGLHQSIDKLAESLAKA